MTLSYLNSHHICRSNFIYRKNVSFNIFKRKKRVPIPCFHYFYHRRVTYRLMTHYTLEDYQKKRSGNHNAYSLPLSIPLSQGLPQWLSAWLPISVARFYTPFAQYTLTWPSQSHVVHNKWCKNSLDNACSGHAVEMVRGYNISPWEVMSKLSNLVNLKVYVTFSFIRARVYSVVRKCA